jgi:cytosine/adenosine deaminase-related metal-dependent hydrolase
LRYRLRAGAASVVVDGDRMDEDPGPVDLSVEGGEGVLLPGLVNAHDHLHRNHFPRLGSPPYDDVYSWGDDLHRRFSREIERARAVPRQEALLFGALKNLLGGATTVVHHDAWEDVFDHGFPVRVPRLRHLHTLRLDAHRVSTVRAGPTRVGSRSPCASPPPDVPLVLHLAEGVGAAAADEVREAQSLGILGAGLVAVHCVGVDDDGARRLRRCGAAVTWCPTSNRFLYGRGPSRSLLRSGVDVLLGTDSLLSGDGTLLDELAAASADGHLDPTALLEAVGATAARRLGLPPPSLRPGSDADLVLFRRPPLGATARDVALVVVAGRPRLGEARFLPLFRAAGVPVEPVLVAGEPRWVEAPLGEVARRVVARSPEVGRILL